MESGWVSSANSSTQEISFWFLVAAVAAAVVSFKGTINSFLSSLNGKRPGCLPDVGEHSFAYGGHRGVM